MIDPNKEFNKKKHPYASPRPEQSVIMIRCDATNCGHKTVISRELWLSGEPIICSNCGTATDWSPL